MTISEQSPGAARTTLPAGSIARVVAAAAIFVGGLVHLQLYYDGYRDFSNANLGRSFMLNAVSSLVVAALLLVRGHVLIRLAGIAVVVGTLIAFFVSRTDSGIFGFTETGLDPSPQALIALVAEIVALLALLATFVPAIGPGTDLPVRLAGGAAVVLLAIFVVGGALWAQSDSSDGNDAGEGSGQTTGDVITIDNFAFSNDRLEVPVGTKVTWTNEDSTAHSVIADDGTFESEALSTGDSFEFTFDKAGEFPYQCGFHPSMKATIVVTG
jgi:plastocyanin